MTLDEVQLAAHCLGMYKADVSTPAGLAAWREHNRKAAALRERIGTTYQPYAHPNKALVKAAYNTLQDEHDYKDFGAVMSCVRGRFRTEEVTP